jgi:hypothetical protein
MAHTPKYKEMTTASWMGAFCTLHSLVKNGVLEKGSWAQTARLFSVSKILLDDFGAKSKKNADENAVIDNIITNPSFFENKKKNRLSSKVG